MERYAHVTAGQQRLAADFLDRAVAGGPASASESVTESVTDPADGVASGRPGSAREADLIGETGSGGRIRTYDHAVNSRLLYH